LPSGDHAAELIERVKKRSSMGTGTAPCAVLEVIVLGSVISRVFGESAAKALNDKARARAGRQSFTRTSG
jgi:hypothetical protein